MTGDVFYLFQYTRKDCRSLNQPLIAMQISVLKYKFVTLKAYMASRVQQTLTLVLSDYFQVMYTVAKLSYLAW